MRGICRFGYAEFFSFISMTEFFLCWYPDLGHFMPMVFSSLLFHMILALSQPHFGQLMVSPMLCFILISVSCGLEDDCLERKIGVWESAG